MQLKCFAKTVFYKFWLLLMQALMVEEAMMVVLLLEVGAVVAADFHQVSHFHTTHNCYNYYCVEPDNMTLTDLLKSVANWEDLAVSLLDDVDGSKVCQIQKSNHYHVEDCRRAMIKEFLKSGNVTWEKVLGSLERAGYTNLATDLKKHLA